MSYNDWDTEDTTEDTNGPCNCALCNPADEIARLQAEIERLKARNKMLIDYDSNRVRFQENNENKIPFIKAIRISFPRTLSLREARMLIDRMLADARIVSDRNKLRETQ